MSTPLELGITLAGQAISVGGAAFVGLKYALNGMRENVRESKQLLVEIRDHTRDSRGDLLRLSSALDRAETEIKQAIAEHAVKE